MSGTLLIEHEHDVRAHAPPRTTPRNHNGSRTRTASYVASTAPTIRLMFSFTVFCTPVSPLVSPHQSPASWSPQFQVASVAFIQYHLYSSTVGP
jgi:hypothetical protein